MNACIEQECEKVAFERWQQQTNDERNENNKHTPRTWTTCYWRMKAHTTADDNGRRIVNDNNGKTANFMLTLRFIHSLHITL